MDRALSWSLMINIVVVVVVAAVVVVVCCLVLASLVDFRFLQLWGWLRLS